MISVTLLCNFASYTTITPIQ